MTVIDGSLAADGQDDGTISESVTGTSSALPCWAPVGTYGVVDGRGAGDVVVEGGSTQVGGSLDHRRRSQYRVELPMRRKPGRQTNISTMSRNCGPGFMMVIPRLPAIRLHPAATHIHSHKITL